MQLAHSAAASDDSIDPEGRQNRDPQDDNPAGLSLASQARRCCFGPSRVRFDGNRQGRHLRSERFATGTLFSSRWVS